MIKKNIKLFTILFLSIFLFQNAFAIVNIDYKAPWKEIKWYWWQNVSISDKTIKIWQDNKIVKPVVNSYFFPFANVNWLWFYHWMDSSTKLMTLNNYINANWLKDNWASIDNIYYDWYNPYVTWNIKYSTDSIDLNWYKKTVFQQDYINDNSSTNELSLKDDWQILNVNNNSFSYNWNTINNNSNSYLNNLGNVYMNTANPYNDTSLPVNKRLKITNINKDWIINKEITVWRPINKNVIVWNWLGSTYDLVYRPHEANNVSKTKWYGRIGQLWRKNFNKLRNKDRTKPNIVTTIQGQTSDQNDFYLPVEIYNWTVVMNVHTTSNSNSFHAWLVRTKNAQERFIYDIDNHALEISDNNDNFSYSSADFKTGNWYRIYFDIVTRNWKQILKSALYKMDSNNEWKLVHSYSKVYNDDYSWWKPNFFLHGNDSTEIWNITITQRDPQYKKWIPWWSVTSIKHWCYYNNNCDSDDEHSQNYNDLLNKLQQSKESDVRAKSIYATPMTTAWYLDTNRKVIYDDKYSEFSNLSSIGDQDNHANIIKAYYYANTTGDYCFAVDGDDAVAIAIDWKEVTWWYSGHGWAKDNWDGHKECINLTKWFHNFFAFQEELRWQNNFVFLAKRPNDTDYHVISPDLGEIYAVKDTDDWTDYEEADPYLKYYVNNTSKSSSYIISLSSIGDILLWRIKYFSNIFSDKKTPDQILTLIKQYYHKLWLSYYNDDLNADINSYNANFWLNWKPYKYQLIASIDRIWWFRNYFYKQFSDEPSLYSVNTDIPSSDYTLDNVTQWYDIKSIDYADKNKATFKTYNWWWYLLVRKWQNAWYSLFTDLNIYWYKTSLLYYINIISQKDSGDFDLKNNINNSELFNISTPSWDNAWYKEYQINTSKKSYKIVSDDRYFNSIFNFNINQDTKTYDINDYEWYNNYVFNYSDSYNSNNWILWYLIDDDDDSYSDNPYETYINSSKVYNISYLGTWNNIKQWLSVDNPTISCSQIMNNTNNSYSNWLYYIKLDSANTKKIYCDFTRLGSGSTMYVDIKWNYSYDSAYNCITQKTYILNDNLECYNPNQYTDTVSKVNNLFINTKWYGIWDYILSDNNKSTTDTKTAGQRTAHWHKDFMVWMGSNNTTAKYVRLGINYTMWGGELRHYWWLSQHSEYQNYDKSWYWPTPWERESSVKPWKIYWK